MTQKIWIVRDERIFAINVRPLKYITKQDVDFTEMEKSDHGAITSFDEDEDEDETFEINQYVWIDFGYTLDWDEDVREADICHQAHGVIDAVAIGCGTQADQDLVYNKLVKSLLIDQTKVIDLRGLKVKVEAILNDKYECI